MNAIFIKDQIKRLKSIIDDTAKVAFYPSSGTAINYLNFNHIPVDFVICSDYTHAQGIHQGKIITVKADNNLCLRIIIEAGIKLDAIFAIQDGAIQGGNYEWVNSVGFLSRLLPALKERFILVNNKDYHHYRSFDEGPVKLLGATNNTAAYRNGVYSTYATNVQEYTIVEYEKEYFDSSDHQINNNIKIIIKRKSIWEEIEDLDAAFINTNNENKYKDSLSNYWPNYYKPIKIYNLEGYSSGLPILGLLHSANHKQIKTIGIIPMVGTSERPDFLDKYYENVYLQIKQWTFKYPETIIFYHIDKNDFKYFYQKIES